MRLLVQMGVGGSTQYLESSYVLGGVRFIWIDCLAALRGWSALQSKQCDPHLYHILLICIILHDLTSVMLRSQELIEISH